jgi:hypothetical protein
VEVEYAAVCLEFEDLLQAQTVDDAVQVDVVLPLLVFAFEVLLLDGFAYVFQIFANVLLVDPLVCVRRLIIDNLLSLFVQIFDFVFDSVVYAIVKYFKNIILLLNVNSDILEVFFVDKKLPVFKSFELFAVHGLFQPLEELQKFSNKQIADNVCIFHFFSKLHSLFGH